jgi:3-hydroxyisobutyrate dehydrogenase-like beta-hydroxyacid dehydrogenase
MNKRRLATASAAPIGDDQNSLAMSDANSSELKKWHRIGKQMSSSNRITSGTPLGFIGLGYLGSRIARRLIAAGFSIIVYDRDPAKTVDFSALGVGVAESPVKLARDVEVVLSCLPDDDAVQDVYFGPRKVLGTDGRYTTIIELSTITPETARRLHQAGEGIGISVLDVAISGSTAAAESGNLTLFGGGDLTVFQAAQPILAAISAQSFHMGPSGSGVAMKLVVNTLLGLGMQAIAEAIALGSGLNLPRDLLLDILAKTAVVAPAHAGKLASAKRNDYAPQFPVRLMRKDFWLILNEAARCGLSMPATEAAAVVNSAEAESGREEDFSAVIQYMERQVEPKLTLSQRGK